MDFADLKGMVETVVQETYFNQISGDLINEVYREAHEEVFFPDLKTAAVLTIATDNYSVQVPSDYGGPVLRFYKEGYDAVTRVLGLEVLLEYHPNLISLGTTGSCPLDYAVEGSTLYFAPAYSGSSDLEMILVYYKELTLLSCDNDEPVYIPDYLRRELLVNGALAKAYTHLERDEQMKPNTMAYKQLHRMAVDKLATHWINRRHTQVKPYLY